MVCLVKEKSRWLACYDKDNVLTKQTSTFQSIFTAINSSPAVVRLHSQSLTGAGNVLLQRGAADYWTTASFLEVWASFWHALAQVHLMKLQDALGDREEKVGGGEYDWLCVYGLMCLWHESLLKTK